MTTMRERAEALVRAQRRTLFVDQQNMAWFVDALAAELEAVQRETRLQALKDAYVATGGVAKSPEAAEAMAGCADRIQALYEETERALASEGGGT